MSDKFNPERGTGGKLPALALTRAGGNTKPAHASIYLLADHLDTLLAACEDIVEARLTWNRARRAGPEEISAEKHATRDDIENIRKLENMVVMRALKSRERAEEVARVDKRFRQLARLYIAGTAVLVDAVADCGDSTDVDFATADSIPSYLRSRGLVDPDAPAPEIGEDIQVGEDFLIAKRIAAGPLMDLAAALLDSLELHYDLFLDEDELAMAPQLNRFEARDEDDANLDDDRADDSNELDTLIEEVREEAANEQTEADAEIWARLSVPQDDPDQPPDVATDATTDDLSALRVDSETDNESDSDTLPHMDPDARASDLWERLSKAAMAAISKSESAASDPAQTDQNTLENDDDASVDVDEPNDTDPGADTTTELSEDDIPTEICAITSKSSNKEGSETTDEAHVSTDAIEDDSETQTASATEDKEAPATLRLVKDDDEEAAPAAEAAEPNDDDAQTADSATESDRLSDTDVQREDQSDDSAEDAEASDSELVISAANDDDELDTSGAQSDDAVSSESDAEKEAHASSEGDETTSDPEGATDTSHAAPAPTDADHEAPDAHEAAAATSGEADQKKSKPKSLLSRLSLLGRTSK